jgi:UDPglucose 6-dehydrogenase/UDP-N-acetyl-D-galactosamine dehydrogenase
MKNKTVSVVGLGYVGLPLADAFSKHLKVIGYDIEGEKVKRLNESNNKANIEFTTDPSKIKQADFVIIAVPTPVTKSNLMRQTCDMSNFFASQKPLLKMLTLSAAETVGKNLKSGATVVLESTVYPDVTEEIVKPVLERESKMKCGIDFYIGYSLERLRRQ